MGTFGGLTWKWSDVRVVQMKGVLEGNRVPSSPNEGANVTASSPIQIDRLGPNVGRFPMANPNRYDIEIYKCMFLRIRR